ncbi:isopenicillin N synthase family dioxygenase [Nitratireductor alexandrii]|uniref:isopenicillin N synthase family dioxygenase n=1 Tax=Nitratireductor alexandrii TaxID=2448161 RepID=UPI0013E0834C|nr:isopenicillin N synthase family oxygenase [Nitratireductor alexandrii]
MTATTSSNQTDALPAGEAARAVPPAKSIPFTEIPLVDFQGFRNGTDADKKRVAAEIGKALNDVGFFYLVNHGIPAEDVAAVFAAARGFFTQPGARKNAVSSANTSNHRGYFPMGGENVDPLHTRDLKEGFDIGFEGTLAQEEARRGGLRGLNQWPDEPAGFRPALERYYEHSVALGRDLCRAFALALDMEEDTFDREIEHSESRMRLLSYPPQPGGPKDSRAFGAGAHTDCGCLTILAQDALGGLAARNSAGDWIAVDPIENALICNVGDIMEQWSGGRFASTVHRVINDSDQYRYSVALFFNPNLDVVVDGFKSLTGAESAGGKTTTEEYLGCCFSETRSACQLP